MKTLIVLLLACAALSAPADDSTWTPTKDQSTTIDLTATGRAYDVYHHGIKAEWGYAAPQQDTFIVIHPKTDHRDAPLYVVLHSAGHDVVSCAQCTSQVGNHDIYRSPDDFYALYLDCRANHGDWWWGGMPADNAELVKKNSGPNPMPVERRVIDSIRWVMKAYAIDPNRVYLCGNSMGGSGTLGIGIRNGDLFAAIKANVPAGIEHAANRMYFTSPSLPAGVTLPDPPVVVDYSAQNDKWSFGHERFVSAMNDRKYALYFYWGPFGHANNSAAIMKVNDLINSFDWLQVKKNEPYAVFTNATGNSPLPWPDHLSEKAPGQVNAFFRWTTISETASVCTLSLFLVSSTDLKTTFTIPKEAKADVSVRRLQHLHMTPGAPFTWTYGANTGSGQADATGVITVPALTVTAMPMTLSIAKKPG